MNKIRLLFFASIKDVTGLRELFQELPEGMTVKELRKFLHEVYPNLDTTSNNLIVAVNHQFADDALVLSSNDEVALFPPVSGGISPTIISVSEGNFDISQILKQITLPTTGATCFFVGLVRQQTNRPQSYETRSLIYEAYQVMAETKLQQLVCEMRERWPQVEGIAILQRLGRLSPGEPSVLIACSAAHRDSGVFESVQYGINRLKEIVPVWKKEIGVNGEIWVEGHYIPNEND